MTFGIYLIGAIIFIGGVAWGLVSLNVPTQWVVISCLLLAGLGILTGATRTRSKDPS